MSLNRDSLLSIGRRKVEISLPDNRGKLFVRELSTAEVKVFVKLVSQANDENQDEQVSLLVWPVIRALVDQAGNPIFSDDDSAALEDMGTGTLKFISQKVLEISGLGPDQPGKK